MTRGLVPKVLRFWPAKASRRAAISLRAKAPVMLLLWNGHGTLQVACHYLAACKAGGVPIVQDEGLLSVDREIKKEPFVFSLLFGGNKASALLRVRMF